MIIFVTGVTGFIGRAFLDVLLQQCAPGDTVRVLVRGDYHLPDARVEVVRGDLRETDSWLGSLSGVAWVFHFAGNAHFGNGPSYYELNVAPVQAMIDALRGSSDFERFVLISSIGAVDRATDDRCEHALTIDSVPSPSSEYGRSKYEAEQRVQSSGLPYTIVRPGWVYGPGMRSDSHLMVIARTVARHSWFASLQFPGAVPLIHVRDLATALDKCRKRCDTLNKTFLAVSENRPLGDVAAVLHYRLHGGAPRRIPFAGFRRIAGRYHRWLPFRVRVLFSNYLAAEDPAFAAILRPDYPILFEEGSKDISSQVYGPSGWWVITGANSGIGRAIAMALIRCGASVIAVDRCVDTLENSSNLQVICADVTEQTGMDAIVAAASRVPLAGLINNAGVGFRGDFSTQALGCDVRTVQVNDIAPIQLTHRLLPQMRRTAATVVNICSSVAYYPLPGMATYAASKAFLLNWSLAFGEEVRRTNLVITFSPSATSTEFQRNAGVVSKSAGMLHPNYVANEVLRAVERRWRHRILGWRSRLLIAVMGVLPITARTALSRILFASYR